MKFRLSLTLLALTLSSLAIHAQTYTRPWASGLAANFFDYHGPLDGDFTQFENYSPGITISAYGYINNAFNFALGTTFAPEVNYPMSENTFIGTSMLDIKGSVRWTMLGPEKFFVPYIGSGFGMNTASNNMRLYVPLLVGFKLQFTESFGLQWESTYQQRLRSTQYQPMSHVLGFVFALAPTRKPLPITVTTSTSTTKAQLPDRDGDGVPDRDDQCPDEPGKLMYLGCPEGESGNKVEEDESRDPEQTPPIVHLNDSGQTNANQAGENGFVTDIGNHPSNLPGVMKQTESEDIEEIYTPPTPDEIARLGASLENVYFDQASFELTPEALSILDRVAQVLRNNPGMDLNVMGHTDISGNERDNIVLSIQRAYKVKYYLVYEKGIQISRISSDGYSSVNPVSDNASDQGRAMNRRVEFDLVERKAATPKASSSRGNK